MFLKIDGIDGESLDDKYHKWIELQTWTWGTNNPVRWDVNQGGHSNKATIDKVTVTKICDCASVTLHQYCMTGRHFEKAHIVCRKNDGEHKLEYLVVHMKDVMVSSVKWTGQGQDTTLGETIDLSFAEFKVCYTVQDDSGDAGTRQMEWGFNIQKQTDHVNVGF
jgi:type VI secretion system secreted protein Hcp